MIEAAQAIVSVLVLTGFVLLAPLAAFVLLRDIWSGDA